MNNLAQKALSQLKNLLPKQLNYERLLALVGLSYVSYHAARLLYYSYAYLIRPRRNLLKRYGEGSWVVVTGASEGIGKAFCLEFARMGFNIVLISRSVEKLTKAAEDIKAVNDKVQTKIISADFSQGYTLEFYENIAKQLEGLDISVLVNNVGARGSEYFHLWDEKRNLNFVVVNCLSQLMMSRTIIPLLLKREKKGAIIDISSTSQVRPMGWYVPYAPTKAFNRVLSQSLSKEYSKKIDIMACVVGAVSTRLNFYNSSMTVTADKCVKGIIDQLGWGDYTSGNWRHAAYNTFIGSIPDFIFDRIWRKVGPNRIAWTKQEEAKEKELQSTQNS